MATEFQKKRKQQEDELRQFIGGEMPSKLREDIAETRAQASKIRSDFLEGGADDLFGSVASRYSLPNVRPTNPAQSRRLERQSESALLDRQRRAQVAQRNMQFNSLVDSFMQRGADLQTAQAYASQVLLEERNREFRESELGRGRLDALERDKIQQEYLERGLYAENQQDLSASVQQAMIRSILGLSGTLGSAYILRDRDKPTTDVPASTFTAGVDGYGVPSGFDTPSRSTTKNRFAGT